MTDPAVLAKYLGEYEYSGFRLKIVLKDDNIEPGPTQLPLNIYIQNIPDEPENILLEQAANLIIKKDGKVKYVVINGFMITPEKINFEDCNGLILKL